MLVRQAGAGFLLVAHRVQARRHSRNTQTSSLPYTAVISLAGLAPRCAHHASVISPAAGGGEARCPSCPGLQQSRDAEHGPRMWRIHGYFVRGRDDGGVPSGSSNS